jgi:FAD/FMN-containing dehydrogenase
MFTIQHTKPRTMELRVNDVHSQLNETDVSEIQRPRSPAQLISLVHSAAISGRSISIGGGRHAMGSQQFLTNGIFVDMTSLNRVLHFDRELGLLEVESGIQWPAVIEYLRDAQAERVGAWCIRQKQTGADNLTIGGAVCANIHGRGLRFKPFVQDIESLQVVDASGCLVRCSRTENYNLFKLVVGGYGLFGLIYSVTIRLMRTTNLRRKVRIARTENVMQLLEEHSAEGYTFGDFQFQIDHQSTSFLREGIFSAYKPTDDAAPEQPRVKLSATRWHQLAYLAHYDKSQAYRQYTEHYLSTDGQVYCSDTHQLGIYVDDYHTAINHAGHEGAGSEIITELYVPRDRFYDFMEAARVVLREDSASVIYGTVRLIERDTETLLAWAKQDFACIVLNLHSDHDSQSLENTAETFRALIDAAIGFGGSFYLTYHKFARKDQIVSCYPEFKQFIQAKQQRDPQQLFNSNWYQHCKKTVLSE